MFPLFNRFHALQTIDAPWRQLFARLSEKRLEVILADKAYVAPVTKGTLPTARIRGSSRSLSTSLLSLVLSTPATSACIDQNDNALVLTCIDKSSLQLVVTVPMLPTPSEALFNELHQSLIVAVASLEVCLLASFGEHEHTDPTHDIHGLQVIHAAPRHGKEPISEFTAFRRMSAGNMSLLAARAFAAAQLASSCRAEKLHHKQVRIERMKQMKKRQRELVEQAKRQNAQRKRGRSVFVEYKPEQDVKKDQPKDKRVSNLSRVDNLESNANEKGELDAQTKSREMLQIEAEKNPLQQETPQPSQEQNQMTGAAKENAQKESLSSAPKRKKRKKTKRLV